MRELVSQELANFTKAVLRTDPFLDIYLHVSGGPVWISGGEFGDQQILSLPISAADQAFIESVVSELDVRLDLDFRFTRSADESDLALYFDTVIDLGGSGTTLGLAIPNVADGRRFWEVILNYKEFNGDIAYLRYALIHELAHALGLEHPFDRSDGDSFKGIANPWGSAYPEDTVMAYRSPLGGQWPQAYTENDWLALESIWGVETVAVNLAPTAISLESVPLLEGLPVGSTVARLQSLDPNPGDGHSYSLVSGEGDDDNHRFLVEADRLTIQESPDFETQSIYRIRLQTTDLAGLSFATATVLDVIDLDEIPPDPPTDLALDPASDTGVSDDDGVTAATLPALIGLAEPQGKVEVFDEADPEQKALAVAFADVDGRWRLNLATPLQEGLHQLVARATDAAGNVSGSSLPVRIMVDPTPPQILVEGADPDSDGLVARLLVNEPVQWSLVGGSDASRFHLVSDGTDGTLFLLDGIAETTGVQVLEVVVRALDTAGNASELNLRLELPSTTIELPRTPQGLALRLSEQTHRPDTVRSLGGPDYVFIDVPGELSLQLLAAERWGMGYVARNVRTGQVLSLNGLGRYGVVARAIPESTTSLALDPELDSALFLHDAFSPVHPLISADRSPDHSGLLSIQRLESITTIVMGGGQGTSIVDLTSTDYITGGVTVLGGTTAGARSVFWGGSADDTFVARGADNLIFGGDGANTLLLSEGRDVLQYVADGQADDTIPWAEDSQHRFDFSGDRIEFWGRGLDSPSLLQESAGSVLVWGDNRLLFERVFNLSLADLPILWR